MNIGHCAVLADQAREEIRSVRFIVFSPRRKLQQFVEHNATMAPDVYAIRVWCKRATHDFHGLQIVEFDLIQIASGQKECVNVKRSCPQRDDFDALYKLDRDACPVYASTGPE